LVSVSPEAARKSIHLKWSEVQKLQTIRGDRTKLIQMMQNILENSIQAAPVGGRVVVETRALMHESRAAAEIKVTDNGAGIAPEVADSLFEPFVTTRAKGTGLGLAIVQRIVKQHAGQISLVTAPEGGAVATVILPIDSELPAAAS
jgi:signal transduction histidine kinase